MSGGDTKGGGQRKRWRAAKAERKPSQRRQVESCHLGGCEEEEEEEKDREKDQGK